MSLAAQIESSIAAVNDWTHSVSSEQPFIALMLGKGNEAAIDTAITAYATASNWTEVAYMKRRCELAGITSTAIDNATKAMLTGVTMFTYKLPNTAGYFQLYVSLLHGYRWAVELNHETAKWDPVSGYAGLVQIWHLSYNSNNQVFYRGNPDTPAYDTYYGGRMYEANQIANCFWIFWDEWGYAEAKTHMQECWTWLNTYLWSTTYYKYSVAVAGWVWDGPPEALQIFGKLWLDDPTNVPNFDRLFTTHAKNGYLTNYWNSPHFCIGAAQYHYVVHNNSANDQRRTGGNWLTFAFLHQIGRITGTNYYKWVEMIRGIGGAHAKGWSAMLELGHGMYIPVTKQFRMDSDLAPGDAGTAAAVAFCLITLGISPHRVDSGTLAIPLESQGLGTPAMYNARFWRWDGVNYKIRIPVLAGLLLFQFGTSDVVWNFLEDGVYEITFASNYNSITSALKLETLPTSDFYFVDNENWVTKPGTWYNLSWTYRNIQEIYPQTGAGVDYPVGIKVYYGEGAEGTEVIRTTTMGKIYCNNHCNVDFSDIRFTDNDGVTPLDYWMEEKVNSSYAIFWVKVVDSLESVKTLICMYYGNPSATTTTSDPLSLDLWQLREYDFYSAYNPDVTFSKTSATVINMSHTTLALGRGYIFTHALRTYLHGKKIRIYWRAYYSSMASADEFAGVYVINNPHQRWKTTGEFADNDNTEHPITDYTKTLLVWIPRPNSTWGAWTTSTSGVIDLSAFSSDFVTLLIRHYDNWNTQSVQVEVDYFQILDASNNILKEYHFLNSVKMEQTGGLRDYGLYRKDVSPEPEHGFWGSEESFLYKLLTKILILSEMTIKGLSKRLGETNIFTSIVWSLIEKFLPLEFLSSSDSISFFQSLSQCLFEAISLTEKELFFVLKKILEVTEFYFLGALETNRIFRRIYLEQVNLEEFLVKALHKKVNATLGVFDAVSSSFLFPKIFLAEILKIVIYVTKLDKKYLPESLKLLEIATYPLPTILYLGATILLMKSKVEILLRKFGATIKRRKKEENT